MTTRALSPNPFLEDFAAHAAELPGAGLPWLDARRADAIKLVRAQGVPHRRVEDWKYTDLRQALESPIVSTLAESRNLLELVGPEARFIGGSLQKNSTLGLSLWDGVEVYDLGSVDSAAPEWVSSNLGVLSSTRPDTLQGASLALMRGGLALHLQRDTKIPIPFYFRFLSSDRDGGVANNARLLIVLEDGASLTLMETHIEEAFFNLGVEFVLGENAKLNHVRVGSNSPTAVAVEDVTVRVARGAQYRAHFISTGAKLSRTELHVSLEGRASEAHVSGVSVLDYDRHADVTTHIIHAAADTRSTQLFKNIAGGHSRGVYQGKITVAEGADGSDSRQTAKGLLLGQRAEIDLKPELEIFADDVKCAHGAAVGDLDVESLFYLRSRGIPEAEARALLMRAFLGDAVDEIENAEIRASVWARVEDALSRATEATP